MRCSPGFFCRSPKGHSMYDDSITTTGAEELLKARIAQAEASLRGFQVTTREDLLATVYSRLNAVLSLGNNVTPLLPVAREGPAIAGNLNGNFRILNQDAQAIIKQLLGTENDAATLLTCSPPRRTTCGRPSGRGSTPPDRAATWRSSSATPSLAPAPRWWTSMPAWSRCRWYRRR